MKKYFYYFFLFITTVCKAQVGGTTAFSFLTLSPSARLTALSNSAIAVRDNNLAFAFYNPSLLTDTLNNHAAFNYDFLLGGISTGYAGFAHHVASIQTTFQAGVQFINYGTFKRADEFGNLQGEFTARETAFVLGANRKISERLSVGVNLKYITSQLESYTAQGFGADLSGSYFNPEKQFGFTVLLRSVGAVTKNYSTNEQASMPTDLQIGLSKKLSRAPFRISVAAVQLNHWNLKYSNPLDSITNFLGGQTTTTNAFADQIDNIFRHLRFGGEVSFGKNDIFQLRVGYNHQAKQELSVNGIRSLSGLSYGFGVRFGKFRFDYGLAQEHLAGSFQHIGLSLNR